MEKIQVASKRIFDCFERYMNARWAFKDCYRSPKYSEVEKFVERMAGQIKDGESITSGGIHMERTNGHVDVYVFVHDIGTN